MYYSDIKPLDITNGIGIRTSLFVSGCEHYCKGCFNKETWNFNAGNKFDKKCMDKIIKYMSKDYVIGFSLLGGEPLHPKNLKTVSEILEKIKDIYPNKTIWVWTGYMFEDVKDLELLKYIDVLVDGKFEKDLVDMNYKYAGSINQRVIDIKKSIEYEKVVLYKG